MLGIGFDSGGTHTSYALNRGEGGVPSKANEAGDSISSARGERARASAVEWIVDVIARQQDEHICAWIGAAGFSASTARAVVDLFEAPLKRLVARLEEENRHCEIFLCNDAIAILKAPPLLGAGVAAVVGTGSVVLGTHPKFPGGVAKRGGYEWVVSDEGSGVWMTLECIRLLLADIHTRGPQDYHSALLDRLADKLGVTADDVEDIPSSHRALARIDLIARRVAEPRADAKRFLASFVHPNIFDLCTLEPGRAHDPIAAEVLNRSVQHIAEGIRAVSDTLAAHTADEPNLRTPLPLVVGGNIAANPIYQQRLRAEISASCRFVSSIDAIGDAGESFAALALEYLTSDDRARRAIRRSIDPLHPVVKLL